MLKNGVDISSGNVIIIRLSSTSSSDGRATDS